MKLGAVPVYEVQPQYGGYIDYVIQSRPLRNGLLKIANRPPSLEIAELKIAILRFCLKNMELMRKEIMKLR